MRVDLRRFKAPRGVSVGWTGRCGKVEEPEEVVVEVESGEASGGGGDGFPHCITSLMSPCIIRRTPLDTIVPCSWNGMM